MKITDGKQTVEITIQLWNGSGYDPDFSVDFFEAGNLPYDYDKDVYTVDSVDDCIEYANDWKNCEGDFAYDADYDATTDNRYVFVEKLD